MAGNYCTNCHQEFDIEDTLITPGHQTLADEDRFETCLQCHDFHGNHKYDVPTELNEAFALEDIETYLMGGPSPYGDDKHHADLEEERRANRRFVELEVSGDDSGLAAALHERGADAVNEGGGRWRIVLPPEVDLDVIWQLTSREELLVHHLTHRRDSLEQIFLKAVGHLETTLQDSGPTPEKVVADGSL